MGCLHGCKRFGQNRLGAGRGRRRGGAFLATVSLLATSLTAQPAEVRGTWLTTTGVDQIRSGYNTQTVVGQLADVGINTLYTEVWKNGYTNYASQTLDNLVGVDRSPFLGQRDLLTETSIQAHRRGLVNLAWFEYGFSPQFLGNGGTPRNPLARRAQTNGWLLEDPNGNYANASNGFAWMNPALPEVRQFLIDLTLEAVRTHDVDGIQFDDRLAWPLEFGWDATTADLYRQETGRVLPGSTSDRQFREWRQSKVTQFAVELTTALREERPDLHLSVSPSVRGFSDVQYNAVWSDWVEQGLFDEYVPQVYRGDLGDFRNSLPSNLQPFIDAGRLDELVVGLRKNGTGGDTTFASLRQQIIDVALAEGGNTAGHAIFYAKGVLDFEDELTAFYGNSRDSPYFAADRRPDPTVATLTDAAAQVWSADVTQAEQYRVVAEVAGRWVEMFTGYFELGVFDFEIDNATAVELLLDRRPIPGDTDFDRVVGLSDLVTLDQSYQTAGGLRQGDFNYDGFVDAADLAVLAEFWQSGIEPADRVSLAAAARQLGLRNVPEPATAGLLGLILVTVVGRRRRPARIA